MDQPIRLMRMESQLEYNWSRRRVLIMHAILNIQPT